MTLTLAVGPDPDNDTARRLLEEELSDSRYAPAGQGLLERFAEWLNRLLGDGGGSGGPSTGALWAIAAVLALLLIIGLALYVRRTPRRRRISPNGPVFDSAAPQDVRSHRQAAEQVFAAGDHRTAIVEAMRAITRSGIERGLLPDSPSLTVVEVATTLGKAYPMQAAWLTFAAECFGAVVYGAAPADAAQAQALLDLEQTLAATRPQRSADPAVTR